MMEILPWLCQSMYWCIRIDLEDFSSHLGRETTKGNVRTNKASEEFAMVLRVEWMIESNHNNLSDYSENFSEIRHRLMHKYE